MVKRESKPEFGIEKPKDQIAITQEQITKLERELNEAFMKELRDLLDKYGMEIQITFIRTGPRAPRFPTGAAPMRR